MRITVEIDEKALQEVKRATNISKSSPAISFIVEDWLLDKKRRMLVAKAMEGRTSYGMTNDELEEYLYHDPD